jgi:hypothetical protein
VPRAIAWYLQSLRAFWSTLIVLCLLAAGGRPSERNDVRDRESRLEVATHAHATPFARRTGVPDGQLRPLFVIPASSAATEPTRSRELLGAEPEPEQPYVVVVRTGSPRGPPRG